MDAAPTPAARPLDASPEPAPATPRFVGGDGVPIPDEPKPTIRENLAQPEIILERDRAARLKLALVIGLKLQGKNRGQIAKAAGIGVSQVDWCLRLARRRNLLRAGLEDALDEFQLEAIPLAMEGLTGLLKKRDKDAIFKTLDGAGITSAKAAAVGAVLPTLAVNIIMPGHLDPTQPIPIPGVAIGRPHHRPDVPEPTDGA